MIERETSKVSGTKNVINAFKNIATQKDKNYLTTKDIITNLSKPQANYVLENMENYEDDGNVNNDAYNYETFVEKLFI